LAVEIRRGVAEHGLLWEAGTVRLGVGKVVGGREEEPGAGSLSGASPWVC
jgi:hypothetical protein